MIQVTRTAVLVTCALLPAVNTVGDDESQSKRRLQLMEQEIAQFAVSTSQVESPKALRFAAKPLLRYSDPTRGLTEANVLMDATVWRLGEEGRPIALVTLEIYRSSATEGILSFEFLSLSQDRFGMQHQRESHITWDASESALSLTPLPDAPVPAANASARLLQMRQFSKRFAVREKLLNGANVECRLLTQPIDRYQAPDKNIVDGAIFTFANGTNLEIGLVFEGDTSQWSYGLVRLSAAETTVLLDDREVIRFPLANSFQSTKGSYVSNNRTVQLPR